MKLDQLKNVLFLDIETVSIREDFDQLNELEQHLWKKKSKKFSTNRNYLEGKPLKDSYIQKAGIFAEFAKVVCITVAYIHIEDNILQRLKVKSFYSHNEEALLREFSMLIDRFYYDPERHYLSGHNIKEFDIPFLARRMLINRIPLPNLFDIRGKKPWQIGYLIDTLEMWRFGDYKNYTSLNLLATALGIPSPKDEMDGSQVSIVYYLEKDLDKIVRYCEKDVITTVQVLLRMYAFEPISTEKIESLTYFFTGDEEEEQ